MVIIGLHGKKGSGKSTVAQYLTEKKGFVELTFAHCLKQKAIETYPTIPPEWFYDPQTKDQPMEEFGGKTPRMILLEIGDECRRKDKNIFVNHVKDQIGKVGSSSIVISDVRLVNEIEMIQDFNLTEKVEFWVLKRETDTTKNRMKDDDYTAHHVTENELEFKDAMTVNIIHNNDLHQQLYEQVDSLYEGMKLFI